MKDEPYAPMIVTAHRAIAPSTLATILHGADLSISDFLDLL